MPAIAEESLIGEGDGFRSCFMARTARRMRFAHPTTGRRHRMGSEPPLVPMRLVKHPKGGEVQAERGGLRRLGVVLAVAAAGVLSVGANAAFAQGTLEICKSSANGMSGRTFEFSIAGSATPVSVKGGRCTGPMTVPHGDIAITELATSPATEVDSVVVRPSQRFKSLNGNTAVVTVPAGSTAANETRITFVNVPAGGPTGDLKICKLSETPAYWGRQFSFSVNGGPAISTEANPAFDDPSTWSCREAGSFAQGTNVTVRELIPAGSEIAWIDSDPADCLQDFDTNAGTADLLIGSGACVVLFDNEPIPPTGTGFLEVCKDAGFDNNDSEVLGVPFDFTIDEPDASSQDITVLGGQCSAPIPVAAGVVRVTEHANAGYSLVGVYTIPEDRLLASNLINRTADVEVPTSDNPNDESQVHFVNVRDRAQLKICKALGPGSSAFDGREFTFNVVDEDGFQRDPLNPRVTASSAGTQCVIVGAFPTGHTVSVSEANPAPYSSASCDGSSPGLIPGTNRPGTITMQPGINTITCTNQAIGKLEICKFVTDRIEFDRTFYFRIDGGPRLAVRAGRCSEPQYVTPGNHTVVEDLSMEYDFELDTSHSSGGIAVTPSSAEVSRNTLARSVTVNVPYAGEDGDEVRVDYYNRIKRGQVKVCKHITPGSADSLGTKEFDFNVYFNGRGPIVLSDVRPGECRLVLDNTGSPNSQPILQLNGNPTRIGVEEIGATDALTPAGTWHVSNLALQGGRGGLSHSCSSTPGADDPQRVCRRFTDTGRSVHAAWNLGPNTNTIHFTNTSNDP